VPNHLLSDDAEVAGRIAVSKKTMAPGQAMGHCQVLLKAGLLRHAAVEYRRSPAGGDVWRHYLDQSEHAPDSFALKYNF
jgi:hypothetical protein